MKIRQVGAEFLRADKTGMAKLIVAFPSCANASKKCKEMKPVRNTIQRTP
jgi:hypothetical protein